MAVDEAGVAAAKAVGQQANCGAQGASQGGTAPGTGHTAQGTQAEPA